VPERPTGRRDPDVLKLAKASVNETQDAQGWRQAMENAFKNYMLTIPHRIEIGTYGPAAREKAPKDRFGVLQEDGLIAQRVGVTTGGRAGPASPTGTLKVRIVTSRMPS